MEKITSNYKETVDLGRSLAEGVLKDKNDKNQALIISLKGDLGAGKTTFMQGFASGLKIKGDILSPTFIIFNRYPLKVDGFKNLYHFDCYRIEREEEILNLEFKDIISNKENIVCIEWPENIKKFIPENIIFVEIEILEGDERKITIDYGKR
jgi:tRNA threonylcarbamoyladenosine biosynthesis protein TsaE